MDWKDARIRQLFEIATGYCTDPIKLEAIKSLGKLAFEYPEAAYALGEIARGYNNDDIKTAATRELGRERKNYM